MAIQYAPLFALETQFQAKDGRNNTGGWLKVFLAATDDPATTYSDYSGTRNPEKIVLDDDGRAVVICDKSKAYRLEVYSIDGTLLWTEEPVYCSGTGGGGVSITKVISTDGSISVDKNVAGSTTTYDLGIAPSSDEFLEWIKCSEEDCGATWYPVFQDGTMETEAGQGVKVHKGRLYHFTNSFTVDPDGTGVNYDTFRVIMYCGDEEVDMREFDIDSSLNDQVLCEFSRDVVPAEDAHVYFKLTIPSTCEVSGETQCHRVYSGINAVPDTCATKQWAQETFDYNMSSKVDYSALGYDGYGQISGISGSAIAGGLDSASVSSIASSVASAYTESAFSSISPWTADFSSISSKADSSSLSAYQPVSAMSGYATEAYVDAKVGDKLDATASSLFLTGLPDDLATTGDVASAVSGKLDKSASGEFYPMTGNPSGFLTAHQSLAGLATVEYVDSSVSSKLDTSAFASASAGFAPTGDYAFNSSLSAYYPASASGAFQPSGNYQTAGDYAFNSSLSSKLDASASSSFVVNSSMSAWIPYSALDYSGTAISGIGGSSLAGMGGGGGDYTGIYPVNVDNDTREIAVNSIPLVTDSSMTAYASAGSSVIGVNLGIMSGKLDESASSTFYTTANESGFLTGLPITISARDLMASGRVFAANTAKNLYGNFDFAGMYFRSGKERPYNIGIDNTGANFYIATARNGYERIYASSIQSWNGKLDSSASSSFYTTDNVSGFVDSAYVDSAISGKADSSALSSYVPYSSLEYNTASAITGINGSALGGMDEAAVSGIASAYAQSAASGKLDTSAFNSGDFYSTSNPSGFITGVDLTPYQPTSAMSGYIPTSVSSDFQQVTGMSSYALSSDVSATVDLVGTQSANWGGSALALSAGPGVKLEKVGDTLVASTDETVLWSGSGYSVGDTMQTYNLSGNPSDFEEIQVYGQRPLGATDTMGAFEFRFHPAYLTANSVSKICVPLAFVAGGSVTPYIGGYSVIDINTTSWHDGFTWQYQPTTTYQGTAYIAHIHKIVGINRTAGV